MTKTFIITRNDRANGHTGYVNQVPVARFPFVSREDMIAKAREYGAGHSARYGHPTRPSTVSVGVDA